MEDKKALEDSEMEEVTGGSWSGLSTMQGLVQGRAVSPSYKACNYFVWLSPAAEVSGAKGRCAVCRYFKPSPGSKAGFCTR